MSVSIADSGHRLARQTLVVVVVVLLLAGCTTSPKVAVKESGDTALSCSGLAERLQQLDETEKAVRSNKSHVGRNAVSAVLWLPGYVYSQNDADRALQLIGQRRSWLNDLRRRRGC